MTLLIFRAGWEGESVGERNWDREIEREKAFSLFMSVVYGVSIVSGFGHVETNNRGRWREGDREREVERALCLFMSVVIFDVLCLL